MLQYHRRNTPTPHADFIQMLAEQSVLFLKRKKFPASFVVAQPVQQKLAKHNWPET